MMMAGINLSTIVIGQIAQHAFAYQGSLGIDTVIFLSSTMNAARDNNFNGEGADINNRNDPRWAYTQPLPPRGQGKDYGGMVYGQFGGSASLDGLNIRTGVDRQAKQDFHLDRIDYIMGAFLALFMILILLGAALFAVRRLLEIMVLYVAAPFFVAMMPLDDGKRFGQWRDLFVAKVISTYSIIIMMNLYLMLVPLFMSATLRLDRSMGADYLMKVMLVLGGALAVKGSASLLLKIIHPQAAADADESMGAGFKAAAGVMLMAGGAAWGGMKKGKKNISKSMAKSHAAKADAARSQLGMPSAGQAFNGQR